MRYTIRHAESRDFLAVSPLLPELGRGELNSASEPIFRERYACHIGRADTASLVAEEDGQVVGVLSMEFRERLNRPNREAWIPDLTVTERSRGRGLGRALLLAAFEIAQQHGCYRISLESGYNRKVAHQLYLAMGMREQGSLFDVEFGGSES